jgi:hypothetical protein
VFIPKRRTDDGWTYPPLDEEYRVREVIELLPPDPRRKGLSKGELLIFYAAETGKVHAFGVRTVPTDNIIGVR